MHVPQDDFSDRSELDTIDDYWKMDGEKSLSEPRTGVTRVALLNKNPPERNLSKAD